MSRRVARRDAARRARPGPSSVISADDVVDEREHRRARARSSGRAQRRRAARQLRRVRAASRCVEKRLVLRAQRSRAPPCAGPTRATAAARRRGPARSRRDRSQSAASPRTRASRASSSGRRGSSDAQVPGSRELTTRGLAASLASMRASGPVAAAAGHGPPRSGGGRN